MKTIRGEIATAKNWAIGLLFGLLSTMFAMGVWVGTIDNRVSNNTNNQSKFEARVDNKLDRIETLLLEITKEVSKK